MDFKAAKCPSCAGNLQLPDNLDSAKCLYCGNTIVVNEAIKLAAGSVNVDNLLNLAKAAFETSNYKEAYDYYTKVLEYDQNDYTAWLGKGISALYQSSISSLRIDEGIGCINTAFSKAPEDALIDLKLKCTVDLVYIASLHWKLVEDYSFAMCNSSEFLSINWKYFYDQLIKLNNFSYNCAPRDSCLKIILDIYIKYYYYYCNSIEEIKNTVARLILFEPSFSFALYVKETNSGYNSNLNKSDFIDFVNSIDNKHMLSQPPTPPAQTNSGGCFIATAAWGTPLADHVVSLSLFRDNQLLQNEYGRRFVAFYYRISPPIADIIRDHALLRAMVRAILKPLVFAVKFMK